MIGWLNALRTDLDAELGRAPKVAALATVGLDGTPRARSVVIRKVDDDGLLTFTTDWRSEKVKELIANPIVTVLFWLPTLKRQYRIAGLVAILRGDDPRVAEQWRGGSDGARATFLWPNPGEPRNSTAVVPAVPSDAPVPDVFTVMMVTPTEVDVLDLKPTPHERTRWERIAGQWVTQAINP